MRPGSDSGSTPASASSENSQPTTREALAAWLPGKPPSLALQAICDGDLLELERRSRELIEREAWLLDVERLVSRGMAVVAYAAHRYNGFPDLDRWLRRELQRAVEALLEQDRELVLSEAAIQFDNAPSYRFLSEILGMPLATTPRATVVFNALPRELRTCWYATVVQKMSIADCVQAGLGAKVQIEARIRRVVHALSVLEDPGGSLP